MFSCQSNHQTEKQAQQNSIYLFYFLLLFLLRENVHLRFHSRLTAAVVIVVVCCVKTVWHIPKQLKHVNSQCNVWNDCISYLQTRANSEEELTRWFSEAEPVLISWRAMLIKMRIAHRAQDTGQNIQHLCLSPVLWNKVIPPLVPKEVMTSVKNVSKSGEVAAK